MARTKIKKAPVSYTPAPAVAIVAHDLIQQFHEHLYKLEIRVDFIFCSEIQKKNGRSVLGSVKRATSLAAYFGREDRNTKDAASKPFYAIVYPRPLWDRQSPEERLARVDHLLCHCGAELDGDGNPKLKMNDYDIREFRAVVDRHGLGDRDVSLFAKSIMAQCPQQALGLDE